MRTYWLAFALSMFFLCSLVVSGRIVSYRVMRDRNLRQLSSRDIGSLSSFGMHTS